MRIIGGAARGRRLYAPEGLDTRPTSDRARESLFNILSPVISGARVLDLFGGTGALALEALSRGARYAAICDIAPAAIRAIRRNADAVLKSDAAARVTVMRADYRQAINRLSGDAFMLVFLDPPYRMRDCYADAIKRLIAADLLAPDAIIVIERAANAPVELASDTHIYDTRVYGDTAIDFARREDNV